MFTLDSKKIIIFGLFALMCIAIVLWGANQRMVLATKMPQQEISNSAHTEVAQPVLSQNINSPGHTAAPTTVVQNSAAQGSQQVQEYRTLLGNPAEAAEVAAWYAKRGFYAFSGGNKVYASYDQATLEKLAKDGDIRAMDALAYMYKDADHVQEFGLEAAKIQYLNAAVYGSTQAFNDLGREYEIKVYDAKTDAEKKEATLEALAYYAAAELRGDRWPNLNEGIMLKRRITFLSADEKFVRERGQQIYNEFQEKRRALGLGDFDNSVPEVVKRFYEQLEQNPI